MYTVLLFLFAAVEVEIEGKHGWAEQLPTWYRVKGWAAKIFGFLFMKKPLTGYHLWMLLLSLLVFHLPYAHGRPFTWPNEVMTISLYLTWAVFWDFNWFVLNPEYGITKFRPRYIWWHRRWFLGLPLDYWLGVGGPLLVTNFILDERRFMLTMNACFFGGTLFLVIIAPHYHSWYRFMRRRDDRLMAGIRHDHSEPPKEDEVAP